MVNWYYVVGSERVGPVSVSALKVLFSNGEITNDTYIWKKGFANWERLKDVAELKLEEMEIESAPVTDLTKLIEGNVAGVTNTYGINQPNSIPVLHIGGVNSMGSSNNALIVIDGVVYKGDLSSIDPKNILEMRILKDTTATSLYGAKGANGVILVTTKTTKHPSNFWNLFRKKK